MTRKYCDCPAFSGYGHTAEDHEHAKAQAAVAAAAPSPAGEPVAFCWLVELFEGDGTGNSAGWYHTGFVDIGGHSRTTKNPHEARRYATSEQAEQVATKLGHTLTGTWRAVEHGFSDATLPAPAGTPSDPVEMSPEFTDTARAALLWLLWHHQGGSSPVGQPLRFALGMGAHDRLNGHQIAEAKRWAELSKSTTAEFHNAVHAAGTPSDPWRDAVDDMLSVQHEVASDDPRESINRLINWNVAVALDPVVSSDAQALMDRGKALAGTPSEEATCDWWQDGEGEDAWDTGCRERFVLNEGTPSENNMRHCCYCGKVLVEHIHVDDDQEHQEPKR